MKKSLKKALVSIFTLSLAFSSVIIPNTPISSILTTETTASAATTGEYKYAGNTFAYEIVGNGSTSQYAKLTRIVKLTEATCPLPSTIKVGSTNYTVKGIANDFAKSAKIRTLSIPDTVTTIGYNFAAGAWIESVGVGKNVQSIGSNFCKDCTSLRSVVYSGTKLTELGDDPFVNSRFINSPNSKGAVCMGEWLIKYTGSASNIRVLDLANNSPDIHKIAYKAFYNNSSLQSVNLNGISVISGWAFRSCSKLKTVTDGYSLSNVESYVFYDTPWFNTQKTNNGGTVMLDRVLLNYTKMTNSTVDLTGLNIQYIANNALSSVKNAKTIKLPNSILSVDRYALCVSNGFIALENLYLYGQKITYSNFSQYSSFLRNNMKAFTRSKWGQEMARQKGKSILSNLGIAYVGKGQNGKYSVEKTYEIVRKLYHYIGSTYKYKYYSDGGSNDFIEEMYFQKGIVCGDYADMTMFLMELAGVNAEHVYSNNHGFNVVEIWGDWFFLDTCWYGVDNLFMVNRTTVERETYAHIVKGLTQSTEIPSEMFTLSGVPYCKYTLGDVNRDGSFTTADKTLFQKYLNGTASLSATQKILSDVNMDGKFNSADLTKMGQMLK